MVAPDSPTGKAGVANARRALGDERLTTFVEFLQAVDQADAKAMRAAVRRLRELNLSVCLLPPRPIGGGE